MADGNAPAKTPTFTLVAPAGWGTRHYFVWAAYVGRVIERHQIVALAAIAVSVETDGITTIGADSDPRFGPLLRRLWDGGWVAAIEDQENTLSLSLEGARRVFADEPTAGNA